MGVGTLRCVVINVTDLQLAYKFWSAVTGLDVIGSETGWNDWLGYLGTKAPWKHEIILQRVDTSPLETRAPNPDQPNQVHIDITPNAGIDQAITDIVELGAGSRSHRASIRAQDHTAISDPFSTGRSCRIRSGTSFAWLSN
jgi:hypothetical protein